ncbi:hypothetical protein B5P43_34110 [Bacillus sp. SRB_336]|nr:hypothetical protein B5P43_34110 [Bacillus sp. SRB_336]
MSGMNMKKMIHQAPSLVGAGVERILYSPSAVVDAASKWGHSEIAGCGTPRAAAGLMVTLPDKKVRRRAQKRAVKALKHAARELHHPPPPPPPQRTRTITTWVAAGLLAAATVAGTIIMGRSLRRRQRCTDQFEVDEGDRVLGGGLAEAPGTRLHGPGQPTSDEPLTHANDTETDNDMPSPKPPAQKDDGPDGA